MDNKLQNINGKDVNIGRIQAALKNHVSIRDVRVVVSSTDEEQFLCAYVVPEVGHIHSNQILRNLLLDVLPENVVAITFEWVDEITDSLEQKGSMLYAEDDTVHYTSVELEITDIWMSVLETNKINKRDVFFVSVK